MKAGSYGTGERGNAMRRARLGNWRGRRWRPTVGILLGLGLLVVGPGLVPAGPNLVTSNTKLLLDGAVVDNQSGESVGLLGLIHVQTRVDPSVGLVAVHANLTDAVL